MVCVKIIFYLTFFSSNSFEQFEKKYRLLEEIEQKEGENNEEDLIDFKNDSIKEIERK